MIGGAGWAAAHPAPVRTLRPAVIAGPRPVTSSLQGGITDPPRFPMDQQCPVWYSVCHVCMNPELWDRLLPQVQHTIVTATITSDTFEWCDVTNWDSWRIEQQKQRDYGRQDSQSF